MNTNAREGTAARSRASAAGGGDLAVAACEAAATHRRPSSAKDPFATMAAVTTPPPLSMPMALRVRGPAASRALLVLASSLRHADARRRLTKRVLDISFAALGLVVTAPLMLLLALIIRLDSAGPALLRQVRVGRNGQPFELIKLRSMLDGASVTRVGRLLRPLGLDELPQLWNVLRGDMSIVGPRPERPHLVAEYQSKLAGYEARHAVRPGITGWAQIHGLRGGERPIAERLRFDLEYVGAQSLWRDVRILALTLFAVWRDTRRELRF